MEADWSQTARMQRAQPTMFQFDLTFVRAARAKETNSLHTPPSRVRTPGARERDGCHPIPFWRAVFGEQEERPNRLIPVQNDKLPSTTITHCPPTFTD